MTRTLKLSVLAAALCAALSGFAADSMSNDEYKAAKDKIEADYKMAKDACKDMKDNAKDVCEKQAKATERIAVADLDYKRSGKDSDRLKAARVKAEQDYAVAKEKCEDMTGAQESACKKEAKAVEAKALADIKAEKNTEKSTANTAS